MRVRVRVSGFWCVNQQKCNRGLLLHRESPLHGAERTEKKNKRERKKRSRMGRVTEINKKLYLLSYIQWQNIVNRKMSVAWQCTSDGPCVVCVRADYNRRCFGSLSFVSFNLITRPVALTVYYTTLNLSLQVIENGITIFGHFDGKCLAPPKSKLH